MNLASLLAIAVSFVLIISYFWTSFSNNIAIIDSSFKSAKSNSATVKSRLIEDLSLEKLEEAL